MIREVRIALRLEALKIRRQKLPWALWIVSGGGAGLTPLLLHLAEVRARSEGAEFVPRSGFEAMSLGVWVGFFMGSILLASMTALSLAGEASRGTMRTALSRATSRTAWFLAKALVLGAAGVFAAVAVWVLAGATSGAAFGFDDVRDKIYPEYVLLGKGVVWRHFAAVALMSLGPVLALVGLGMLVSALTDEPAVALAVILGMVLFGPIVGSLVDGMGPYLVFSYTGEWLGHLREIAGGTTAAMARVRLTPGNLLPPAGVAIAAGAGALFVFRRRDILA